MEKELVPYEPSSELKELGFDEPCFGYYVDGELRGINLGMEELGGIEPYYQRFKFHTLSNHNTNNPNKIITTAPTFSQAFRWFRENHGISVSITINWEEGIGKDSSYGKYACSLEHKSYNESIGEFIGVFKRYEEAELECLKGLIEMVKPK